MKRKVRFQAEIVYNLSTRSESSRMSAGSVGGQKLDELGVLDVLQSCAGFAGVLQRGLRWIVLFMHAGIPAARPSLPGMPCPALGVTC